MSSRAELGWYLTALAGRPLYSAARRAIDAEILQYLEDRDCLKGEVIADVACGFGVFAIEAAQREAGRVLALDKNSLMIARTQRRARKLNLTNIVIVHADMYADLERTLPEGVAAVNFNSCLYGDDTEVIRSLRIAYSHLKEGGFLSIRHPEKDFSKYVRGSSGYVRLDHAAKYVVNRFGDTVGLARWRPLSATELEERCDAATENAPRTRLFSPIPAYNVMVVRKP